MYVYAVSNVSIFLSLSLHCSLISEMMFELKFHRLLCKQDAVASIIVREQLLVTQIVDVYKHISNILEVVVLIAMWRSAHYHWKLPLNTLKVLIIVY